MRFMLPKETFEDKSSQLWIVIHIEGNGSTGLSLVLFELGVEGIDRPVCDYYTPSKLGSSASRRPSVPLSSSVTLSLENSSCFGVPSCRSFSVVMLFATSQCQRLVRCLCRRSIQRPPCSERNDAGSSAKHCVTPS